MFNAWTVIAVVLAYLLILFLIAFWGDRYNPVNTQRPIVYSLALGVHCTSWAFFGTTTQSAQYGWAFIPTYLGIILVFVFAHPLLRRIASLCHQHKVSSLADFISLRFEKSLFLAALITLLCFFGVIPYIALQLDAVTSSIGVITRENNPFPDSAGFYVAALMALFAILFGTRTLNLTDKHPGLMLTIAFESLVKLFALLAVGLFTCYALFDGPFDLLGKAQLNPQGREIIYADSAIWVYLSHLLMGICAMFCLPRQFHINYIENNGEKELHTARWLFPAYLCAMTLFVLPIALAGNILFAAGTVSTDSYVLALPVHSEQKLITMVSFIGGLSAATSMVIVATLAMGIMISNNLATPLFLKFQLKTYQKHDLKPATVLLIRRLTVLVVLGVAYLYHLRVSQAGPLVKTGTIAIALLSQSMPIIMFGLFWPKASKLAAQLALTTGALCWCYLLLWPSIKASYYFDDAPTDLDLSLGFIISLLANCACFIVVSLLSAKFNKRANSNLPSTAANLPHAPVSSLTNAIKISSLLALTEKVLAPHQYLALQQNISPNQADGYASQRLLDRVEGELAGQVGSASSRILLSAIAEKKDVALSELVGLIEEASQAYQFNHELLQSSVEHIQQGISVMGRDLTLLAWNQRYLQLFDYPEGFIKVGLSIREILEFNAQRGMLGSIENTDVEIEKRINYMLQGSGYKFLRHQQDGKVIEINGSPLPSGGFVTTYSDITEYIRIQQALRESKLELETRVEQRTEQLLQANLALGEAKLEAESANDSKSKFLAAAGHDLMQPFNAASLFASMLMQKANTEEISKLSSNLVQSLNSAEELLSMLLDMTRLESGKLSAKIQTFYLDDILSPLINEFSLIASQKGLTLRYLPSQVVVTSDKKLLRRIMQNLISNAIRYTTKGKVLVVIKRSANNLKIRVIDTGPGIALEQQKEIFQEFHQLGQQTGQQGLGLGLTIVERMSALLNHPVTLQSVVGRGTCFEVLVPRGEEPKMRPSQITAIDANVAQTLLTGKILLIIENDPQILEAISQLFSSWGAQVLTASDLASAKAQCPSPPDLMLLDYHLDHGLTGVEAAMALCELWQEQVPGILNSADRSEEIRRQAIEAQLHFLPKPIKPAALKRLLKQLGI
jgi:Na+/proline symporter/signal transduction histidine kinase